MAAIGRSISSRALIALLGIACLACGGPSPYAGKWSGERDLEFEPGTDPALAGTARRVTLTIERDGAFKLVDGGMPLEGFLEGDRLAVRFIADRTPPPGAGDGFSVQRTDRGLRLSTPTGNVEMQSVASATPSATSP